jgi:hypothetical protein
MARVDNAALLEILEEMSSGDGLMGTGVIERDLENLRILAAIPLEYDEHATWPTISVQVPPYVKEAYYSMTSAAVGERERFEMMLRLAGWDGRVVV